MNDINLKNKINEISKDIGNRHLVVKFFIIGKIKPINAAILYLEGLTEKNIIDRDVLSPLMFRIDENLSTIFNLPEYLCEKYISMSNTMVEKDINKAIYFLKRGCTIIVLSNSPQFILIDTSSWMRRAIDEPPNEVAIRGSREGFTENLESNLSMIKRKIKDKNLSIEKYLIGSRGQTDLAIVFIEDIIDKEVLNEIRKRIKAIDVDSVLATGVLEQYIEDYAYSPFPQSYGTERPDIIAAALLEGRAAIVLDGTPYVITYPSTMIDFFQTVEDYYERTLISSFIRIIRFTAVTLVYTLPSLYLALIKFNSELIPIKFVIPIVQSRKGIALTPFMEILSMLFVIELLRESGLRLPSRISQTVSVVGGFIIGNAALQAKLVSPATMLIVGITAVCSFSIPNYEMAQSVRIIAIPVLILANVFGVLGVTIGWYFIVLHLFSIDSFGVPYLNFNNKSDFKDIFLRYPLWKMNKRPASVSSNNSVRQKNFRKIFRRSKNE